MCTSTKLRNMAKFILLVVLMGCSYLQIAKTEVATTNNQLALKLYYHLAKNSEGDFLFAPFSISSLISILGGVAGEGTAETITGAMEYTDDYQSISNDYKRILIDFQKLQSLNESSMELQQKDDLKLSYEFKHLLIKYLADVGPLRFTAASGYTGTKSENYMTTLLKMANRTDNEIDQLLQFKSTLNFKGSWSRAFNPSNTKPSPFYNMTRRPYLVETMFQRMEVPYADIESLDCTAIGLPYRLNYSSVEDQDSRLELLIFVPNSLTGLHELEKKLVQQPFSVTLREFTTSRDLFVYLPKFEIKSELDLKPILKQVGLESLFLSDNSNFTKIFQDYMRKQTGQFGVFKTSHFGRFSVDEYGTNGSPRRGLFGIQPAIRKHLTPDVFRVDRPFVGVLYDNARHMVLLMFRKIDFVSIDPLRQIAVPDALTV